jgi:hypothetical protein
MDAAATSSGFAAPVALFVEDLWLVVAALPRLGAALCAAIEVESRRWLMDCKKIFVFIVMLIGGIRLSAWGGGAATDFIDDSNSNTNQWSLSETVVDGSGRKFSNDGESITSPMYDGAVVSVSVSAKNVGFKTDGVRSILKIEAKAPEAELWAEIHQLVFVNGSATNETVSLSRRDNYRQFRLVFVKEIDKQPFAPCAGIVRRISVVAFRKKRIFHLLADIVDDYLFCALFDVFGDGVVVNADRKLYDVFHIYPLSLIYLRRHFRRLPVRKNRLPDRRQPPVHRLPINRQLHTNLVRTASVNGVALDNALADLSALRQQVHHIPDHRREMHVKSFAHVLLPSN